MSNYSQTCFKRPLKGNLKSGLIQHVVADTGGGGGGGGGNRLLQVHIRTNFVLDLLWSCTAGGGIQQEGTRADLTVIYFGSEEKVKSLSLV